CGSWLACDSGLSVTTSVPDTPLSQASQLPHLISIVLEIVNNPAFSPSGLPLAPVCRYTRRLSKVRQRVLPAMEINPILNTIKDLSERSETIRGYL
ncbi:hypothetical protein, partial [Pseudomonas edaphica]|uniref:hypothetical protein n=1 Tax=Pseudomonas edaphica TaxID=2006980 RepID=UPI0019807763